MSFEHPDAQYLHAGIGHRVAQVIEDAAADDTAARQREARIRDAIDRAELPYEEVSSEVDRFIRAMEDGARRGICGGDAGN